ncbi:MAG: CUB domain-containing protein [Bacteroidetes bacterium]|nr:CUB domain-containing protein [Bacteroidota bacterium]
MFKKTLKSNLLFKIWVVVAIISFGILPCLAQDTIIEIGSQDDNTEYFPIDRYHNYSRWEGIYQSNEINHSGYITSLGFYLSGNFNEEDLLNVKIYVKSTSSIILESGDFSLNNYLLVYDGNLYYINYDGWINFNLTTPFYYNNIQNLQIAIEHSNQYLSNADIYWAVSNTNELQNRANNSNVAMPVFLNETNIRPILRLGMNCMFINKVDNKSICIGKSTQIGADTIVIGAGGNYTYQWSPNEGINDVTLANPIVSPIVTTEYTVTVNTIDSTCTGQSSYPVVVFVKDENSEVRMGDQDVVSMCSGVFYDSGGYDEEYHYNENRTLTIYPCDSLHNVSAVFQSFNLESSENCDADWLKIYDGNNSNCNLIGIFCSNDRIDEIISSHLSGALTFVFHSNDEGNGNGWIANISCVDKACRVIAGTATITSAINDYNSGNAVLGLNGYLGTFVKWQDSYNRIDFSDIFSDSINPHTINTSTTYYRAVVTYVNSNGLNVCYSNVIKYLLGINYYVNDATQDSDIFCTSIGNNNNDGLSKENPVLNLSYIISHYDLKAGDVVFVDAGIYSEDILFGPYDYGDSLKKVRIIGAGALNKTKIEKDGNTVTFESTSNIEFKNIFFKNNASDGKTIRINYSSGILFNKCIIENGGENLNIIGRSQEVGEFSDNNRFYNNIFKTRNRDYHNIKITGIVNNSEFKNNIFQYMGDDAELGFLIGSNEYNGNPFNINIDSNYFNGYLNAIYAVGNNNYPIGGLKIKNNWINCIDTAIKLFNINIDSSEISFNRIRGKVNIEKVSKLKIFNNFISNSDVGISLQTQANDIGIYYNSFYNAVNNIQYYNLYNSNNLFVQNNIFYNTSSSSGNACLSMNECSNNSNGNQLDSCNNNLYYTPNGASFANFGSSSYSTIEELKLADHVIGTANGDENSITSNPLYEDLENGNLSVAETSPVFGKGISIPGITTDINHFSRSNSSIGASLWHRPSVPFGPYAILNRKLDGGYHFTKSGYLLIKYTEEYNKASNAKLIYKIFNNKREIILSSFSGIGLYDLGGNTNIKYGDNYCSINLFGCGQSTAFMTKAIPVGYYILEVSNDKNEKWYLRFKNEFEILGNPMWGECLQALPDLELIATHLLNQ